MLKPQRCALPVSRTGLKKLSLTHKRVGQGVLVKVEKGIWSVLAELLKPQIDLGRQGRVCDKNLWLATSIAHAVLSNMFYFICT